MIDFEKCYFEYDNKPLINNFTTKIIKGSKIVLYGPSGSGKSTILHAILGFVEPKKGIIRINNEVITTQSISQIRTLTSWLPQDLSLPYTSILEMIYAPFEFKSNQKFRPTKEIILKHFEALNLDNSLLDKKIDEISGGQKQRILLLTTVLLQKPIILLDEPTSALDAQSVNCVINYLKSQKESTIIAVSHDESFINAFDNKIYIPKL